MGKGIYINDSIHGLIWLSDYERKNYLKYWIQ